MVNQYCTDKHIYENKAMTIIRIWTYNDVAQWNKNRAVSGLKIGSIANIDQYRGKRGSVLVGQSHIRTENWIKYTCGSVLMQIRPYQKWK